MLVRLGVGAVRAGGDAQVVCPCARRVVPKWSPAARSAYSPSYPVSWLPIPSQCSKSLVTEGHHTSHTKRRYSRHRNVDVARRMKRHHRSERPAGISPIPPVSALAEKLAMRNPHYEHSALSNCAAVPPAEPERCSWLMIMTPRTADATVLRRRPRRRAHHVRKVADVTDRRHQPRHAGTTEVPQVSMITGGHNYGV